MLPTLHAVLVGAWIGTVLVEALFERALLGQGRDKELILARLHWKVDKLACAALAVFANLYCVWLVRLRGWLFRERLFADHRQHRHVDCHCAIVTGG